MDINKALTQEFGIKLWQVEAVVKLVEEGNTIPFIARYRKEAHGTLTDEVLRNLNDRLTYLTNLEQKKDQVIAVIVEQGAMTPELLKKIQGAATQVEVEDIYRPYRPKRKTRATVAKAKGLEPLALVLMMQSNSKAIEEVAADYVSVEKEVDSVEAALAGARDIIAEQTADEADYRKYIREWTFDKSVIVTKAKNDKEKTVFEMYYDYEEEVRKIVPHRILAINRGEKEKILSVKVLAPEEKIIGFLTRKIVRKPEADTAKHLTMAAEDGYKRLIAPSIERDIRNELTEKAQEGAISVFGKNLVQLLMAAPILGKRVLALDPAFRTGCKVASIDEYGKVLGTGVIYPTAPHNKVDEAKAKLKVVVAKHHPDLIAIGNGTASRETESFVADMLREVDRPIQYVIVNEAGASVYSACSEKNAGYCKPQ